MSSEPLRADHLARVSPLHPSRRGREPVEDRSFGLAEAERLVPAEVLRACREALQRFVSTDPPSYGVTSAIRGEGRSSIALGFALAEWLDHERRTVIVDLDLEAPALHRRLGLRERPGLEQVVDGQAHVEDYVQRAIGDVWLLSAGAPGVDAPRALNRFAQSTLLSQLSEWAEAVVFDLPPLLGSPTGLEASRLCTTPVMVVRAGVTPLPRVKEAVELLSVKPPVVLNGVSTRIPRWLRRAAGDWS
ncbi:MAG: CpsD/CapB family tyrosine-protein kinase [Candidatus Dormiibacterota bacterium]